MKNVIIIGVLIGLFVLSIYTATATPREHYHELMQSTTTTFTGVTQTSYEVTTTTEEGSTQTSYMPTTTTIR